MTWLLGAIVLGGYAVLWGVCLWSRSVMADHKVTRLEALRKLGIQ